MKFQFVLSRRFISIGKKKWPSMDCEEYVVTLVRDHLWFGSYIDAFLSVKCHYKALVSDHSIHERKGIEEKEKEKEKKTYLLRCCDN